MTEFILNETLTRVECEREAKNMRASQCNAYANLIT